jgi:outer membrane protein
LLAVLGVPVAAWAADPVAVPSFLPPSSDWTVTLGAEGRFEPKFPGSDRDVWRPNPLFDARRVGTPERFRAPRDGAGIGIIESGSFQLGPVGQLRIPRRERDDVALRGLGDVDWAVEIGAFAEYWAAPWLRLRGEARQGVHGHHGFVADLTMDAVVPITGQWTLSGGPRVSFATSSATRPYFSVNALQSVASGLPVFDATGGIHSAGAGAQVRYRWTPDWATHAFLEYERLLGDAGKAPLVVQRGDADQLTFGLGLTRSFDIKSFW